MSGRLDDEALRLAAGETWRRAYADRRDWERIEPEAQEEWVRVFGVYDVVRAEMGAEVPEPLRLRIAALEAALETERLSNRRLRAQVEVLKERLEEVQGEEDDEREVGKVDWRKMQVEAVRIWSVMGVSVFAGSNPAQVVRATGCGAVKLLLELEGDLMVRGGDRDELERMLKPGWEFDECDLRNLRRMLEDKEREANLRGQEWNVAMERRAA